MTKRIDWGTWNVRAAAFLVATTGVVTILSSALPGPPARVTLLGDLLPPAVHYGARLGATLTGAALLGLAHNLWRRKRVAWMLALGLLALSAATHLAKALDVEEAAVAIAVALWLWRLRHEFHALSDPPSLRQGLRILAIAFLITLGYGTLGFYLLDRHFSVTFSLSAALRQTVAMFTEFYDPGLEPISGFGRYFATSIYTVGIVTLAYGLVMLFRPVLVRSPATLVERVRAQEIVRAFGRSSLARLTLLDDKRYFFTRGGSVLAYALEGRIALVLGDPIGPPEDLAPAVAAFNDHCRRSDWVPAFYQTLPDTLGAYRGFDALCIGHEAIVDLTVFTLKGGSTKALRAHVNRLARQGHRAVLHPAPIPAGTLAELREVSDAWLTMMRTTEKRFSLGWFCDDYVAGCPVMAVEQSDGRIVAFANIIPEYTRNEATIDLMRRRRDAESGTMDLLFVALFEWAKAEGFATFNLGLSPLAGVGERPADPALERALHFVYKHLNNFYRFTGLHAFKEKFRPEWSPRYLRYPGAASLPAVGLAVVRADSGGGLWLDALRIVADRLSLPQVQDKPQQHEARQQRQPERE